MEWNARLVVEGCAVITNSQASLKGGNKNAEQCEQGMKDRKKVDEQQ